MVLLESCLSQLCFPSWPNVIPEIPPLKSSFPSDYIQNALKNKGISWKKYKQFIFCCFLEEKNMYKRYVQYVITWYMMYSSILQYILLFTKKNKNKNRKTTEGYRRSVPNKSHIPRVKDSEVNPLVVSWDNT